MKKYSRSHPRYRVKTQFPLKLEFPSSRFFGKHALATIGMGGFGFFGTSKQAELLQSGSLNVLLFFGNRKVEVRVRMKYCQFLPKRSNEYFSSPYFIGLQYEEVGSTELTFIRNLIQAGVLKGHLYSDIGG